jgi:hypothetical protein
VAEVAVAAAVAATTAAAVAVVAGPSPDAPSPAPLAAVAVSSASLAPFQGTGRVAWVGVSAPPSEEGRKTLNELPEGVPPRGCLPPSLIARPSTPSLTAARSFSPLSSNALSRARQASADGRRTLHRDGLTLSMGAQPLSRPPPRRLNRGTQPLARPPPRTDDPVAADDSANLLGPVVDLDMLLARRMYAAYSAYYYSLPLTTHCSRTTAYCSLLGFTTAYYTTGTPPTAPTPPAPTAWRCAGPMVQAAYAPSLSLRKQSA